MEDLRKKQQLSFIFLSVILIFMIPTSVFAEDGTWEPLGDGVSGTVNALAVDSHGNLYVGGDFLTAGGETVNRVAKWDGSSWSALNDGAGRNGVSGPVYALTMNSNDDLYVGGSFNFTGTMTVNNIAKWDGSSWAALDGVDPQGVGVAGTVYAMDVDDSNLYVGGWFTFAGGTTMTVGNKVMWDGSSWSALGDATWNAIYAMAADGSDLYIGGAFDRIGGATDWYYYIAKWNGNGWVRLNGEPDARVNALAMDSSGNLYAGGEFTTAGEVTVNRIAKWDGSEWSALGSGMNGTVNALAIDSSGNLYAGGDFTTASGVTVNGIAKWDGSEWSALGSGIGGGAVNALAKGSVYVGGNYTTAGGVASNRLAVWEPAVAVVPVVPVQPKKVQVETLPQTGFAQGLLTQLPRQELSEKYQQYSHVSLEIPSQGVEAPIVGVPISQDGWDLTWLGDQAGWLNGTAFPSWAGNSAITAHVYDANGQPGLFNDLGELKWGDEVIVRAYGQDYIYEVRTVKKYVRPDDTSSVFEHEDYPWLTLITCKGYDEESDSYRWRVVVRAVQVDVR